MQTAINAPESSFQNQMNHPFVTTAAFHPEGVKAW